MRGWTRLIREKGTAVSAINESPKLAEELMRLTLIADEASRGIGVTWNNKTEEGRLENSRFLLMAGKALTDNENESYCWDVPTEALCVVGKQHTPMKGATFRSLSHHLALYHPSEIKAIWILPPTKVERPQPRPGLNLLLLPWPERVETPDFQEVSSGESVPMAASLQVISAITRKKNLTRHALSCCCARLPSVHMSTPAPSMPSSFRNSR